MHDFYMLNISGPVSHSHIYKDKLDRIVVIWPASNSNYYYRNSFHRMKLNKARTWDKELEIMIWMYSFKGGRHDSVIVLTRSICLIELVFNQTTKLLLAC